MPKRAVIFLHEGFEELEAITPLDYLRRAGVELTSLGFSSLVVEGSHGIRVQADILLDDYVGVPDAIIVPGGPGTAGILGYEKAVRLLQAGQKSGAILAAICAAPALIFAPLGILEGRRFTCFMGMEKQVSGARFLLQAVVTDGNIITSRSAGTAAEFAEALVHELVGPEAARELAEKTWSHWIR